MSVIRVDEIPTGGFLFHILHILFSRSVSFGCDITRAKHIIFIHVIEEVALRCEPEHTYSNGHTIIIETL